MAPHQVLGQAFPGPTGAVTIYEPSEGNEGLALNLVVANVFGPTGPVPVARFRTFVTGPDKKFVYDQSTATMWNIQVPNSTTFESEVYWGIRRDGPTGITGTIGVQSSFPNSLTFTIFGREDPAPSGPTGAFAGGGGPPLGF